MNSQSNPNTGLGAYTADIDAALAGLARQDVVGRIWRGDHTVWSEDPTEITDRLGWLTSADNMRDEIGSLTQFATDVKTEGYRHVVLLGMGGSSLGPEVLRQTFGSADGYPELIVLDSTAPESVQAVADAIDPARTLFLVSSKSGSTIEPNAFYGYFRQLVEQERGPDNAGRNFVAITDAGTVLDALGQREGFRQVFGNQPDIGGRYSVLSHFGLTPAALIGIDLSELLDRADSMRDSSGADVPVADNPGAWLGAVIGTLSLKGRDKLTVLTSPSLSSFGLWAEQLIAESLGKQGRGIVPIAGEPIVGVESYGDDRVFAYLWVEGDENNRVDELTGSLANAGYPVIRLDLKDRYDLAAEFFRWEFATAVAGSIIGVTPFDQPNVQAAKDATDSVLETVKQTGALPESSETQSFIEIMESLAPGDYVAIMTYVTQAPELDLALDGLRTAIVERYGVATTLGYGPRFLHSTGQLHKGGPNSGVFVQLTSDHTPDTQVPGMTLTFGVLVDAQALGDLLALQAAKRRTVRIDAGESAAGAVRGLIAELGDNGNG
ncbi:MAG: glucose-6-phosphate isomerase [SAR202 cluster bacterium]|nr:glucose-6-phosphate isomerase [SAR202 cluster bacterium]MDP7104838.1 glucose-6-phosphate isomerase [SAR202 cluster bacterium]MDP7412133.1 glucose-6-phosphate isomerase [SAR202 cluster bacterium]